MKSMARKLMPALQEDPSEIVVSGQEHPRLRDVVAGASARAHADAEPDDQDAARRLGKTRRTWTRGRHEGPREVREFNIYLLACADPWRMEAHVKATAKHRTIARLSTPDLIERFHELRAHEKRVEGADSALDVTPGEAWLDRAASKERDAAIDEELAAVMREFAARGLSEADVMNGGGH